MYIIRRLTSSQSRRAKIKQEPESDPEEPLDKDIEAYDSVVEFEDGKTEPLEYGEEGGSLDNYESFGGLEDPAEQLKEELLREESAKAPKTKVRLQSKEKTKKKGKGKRKEKKVEPEPDTTDEEDNNVENEEVGAEVEDHSEISQNGLEVHSEGEDLDVESQPKPKRTRKATASGKTEQPAQVAGGRRPKSLVSETRSSVRNDELDEEEDGDEDNPIDAVRLLNEARMLSNVGRAENLAEMVGEQEDQNLNLRKLGNIVSETTTNGDPAPSDLAAIPSKMTKMRIAQARRTAMSQGDEDGPVTDSHQLPTPNPSSYHTVQDSLEDALISLAQPSRNVHAIAPAVLKSDDDEPIRPSKKALGKRKVGDELSKEGSKKRIKRTIDNGAPNGNIKTWLSSDPATPLPPRIHVNYKTISQEMNLAGREVDNRQGKVDEPSLFIAPSPLRPTNGLSKSTRKPKISEKPKNATPLWKAINKSVEDASEQESEHQPNLDTAKDDEDPTDPSTRQSPEFALPKQKEHRKRRLPIDESDTSGTNTSKDTRSGPKVAQPKTPKTPASQQKGSHPPSTTGKLISEDTNAIADAIAAFKEIKDLSDYQLNELVQQSAREGETKELWKSVCEEVSWIPSKKVLDFCRRKYHNFEARGQWSEEQDEELRIAYASNPQKWALIGREINRFPEDVRDRWRNYLVCGDNMRKDAWDQDEEDRLNIAVEECLAIIRAARRRSGNRLLLDDEEKLIDWNKVSERMGHTRSRLQCSYKWKQLKQRLKSDDEDEVAKQPISTSWRLEEAYEDACALSATDKLRLLQAIQGSGAGQEGKIPWGSIRNKLDEGGKRMTWKVCFRRLKEKIPGYEGMKFQHILEELIDAFEASVPDEPDGFALDRPAKKNQIRKSRRVSHGDEHIVPDRDSGEGPSTSTSGSIKEKKFREGMRNEQYIQETAANVIGDGTSASTKHLNMLNGTTSQSSSIDEAGADDDVEGDSHESLYTSLQSLKSSNTRKSHTVRKAKTPIKKSKRSKILSEKVVVEDLSDEESSINGVAAHDIKNDMEIEDGLTKMDSGSPETDDTSDSESQYSQNHDSESVDLDAGKTIVNGFHEDSEAEEVNSVANGYDSNSEDEEVDPATNRYYSSSEGETPYLITNEYHTDDDYDDISHDGSDHGTESMDLDTPHQNSIGSKLDKLGSPLAFGSKSRLNGFRDSSRRSVSSDASSIPAKKLSQKSRMASVEL